MRMNHFGCVIGILIIVQAGLYPADQQTIQLQNGDKVSGYIIRETEDSLFGIPIFCRTGKEVIN